MPEATKANKPSNWKDFRRMMHYGRNRLLPYFTGMLFMTLANSLMRIVGAFVSKYLIDAVTSGSYAELQSGLWIGVIGMLVTMVVWPTMTYLYNYQNRNLLADMRRRVFRYRGKLPAAYFENSHSGDFISRLLHDTDRSGALYTSRLRRFLAPILGCVVQLVPMLILDARMTAVLFGVNLIFLFCNTRFAKPMREIGTLLSKSSALMLERLVDLIAGVAVIKSNGVGEAVRADFSAANEENTKRGVKSANLSAWLESMNFAFDLVTGLAFLLIASVFVESGLTTFGTLVGLISLQKSLSWQMLQAGRNLPEVTGCLASARRIFDFLDETPEPEHYGGMAVPDDASYISMRDVSFAYDSDRPVLNGFNLDVRKGKRIALAGPSGGGKSTIVKLLLGLYPPSTGSIIIDGETFTSRRLSEIREKIAYVPQDTHLYNDTILQNIRYGKLTATDDEVIAAAKAANAHDFILEQPEGYDTVAGERGARLSGGQRQRIAIARAILKDAPILLLDEASSALDNESERLVQEAIERLGEGRTVIIVAHRPSTIASADEVVYVGVEMESEVARAT